jgi:Cu-Zn family superoxide dismutase
MNKLAMGTLALMVGLVTLAASEEKTAKPAAAQKAVAVMQATSGSKVTGVVTFTARDGHVEVSGEIHGLTPGLHGFHVHEFGDISAPDGSSAGNHFNPTDMPHGGPEDAKHHVGDLGNIEADTEGKAIIKLRDQALALDGPHSIIGRTLVVHAKADDLKSQPSGDAGDRVGCGVIGLANPKPPPKQ